MKSKKDKEYEKAKKIVEKYEKEIAQKERLKERESMISRLEDDKKYVVRQYDWFDHHWLNVDNASEKEKVIAVWDKYTKNGTQNTKYEDGDYYAIFPEDTRMIFS